MGFRFRKSVNFGPFRVNLSKSGVGYSFGGKGFRFTKKSRRRDPYHGQHPGHRHQLRKGPQVLKEKNCRQPSG